MQSSLIQRVRIPLLRCPHCHQRNITLDTEKPLAFDLEGTQEVAWYLATCGSCGHQGIVNSLEWTVSATSFEQIPHCLCACGCQYCFELRSGEDARFVGSDGTLVCRNCAILCLGELDIGEE